MNLIDQPLGQLARTIPGATRIFREYDLDFCCGGKQSLRRAAAEKALDPVAIETRLLAANTGAPGRHDWSSATVSDLIDHILVRYHERHREQLPELIRLARKVEQVHADRTDCPAGLAELLHNMRQALESHMQKEEQVLFPMLARGHAALAGGPIMVMRMEHDHHGQALRELVELTHDITLPRGACNTWRALYLGLAAFRDDLMDHIHLENNILFEDASRAAR